MNKILKFLYSFFTVTVTAFAASYFTQSGLDTFYNNLQFPPFTPDNQIFPLVWSVLYTLMIISYYLILTGGTPLQKQSGTLLFLGQLFLQIVWTYLFFYTAYFLFAGTALILLIWTVYAMIQNFRDVNPVAASLQYPYFLWLLFAAYLNFGIVYLNGYALNP